MRLVEIEWVDSRAAQNEWEYRKRLKSLKVTRCKSVGYLIEERRSHKTIVQSYCETQVLGRISIPTVCIKKCRTLK